MGVNDAPARRPGGLARLACLLAAGAGFFTVFSIGFPPASRDRLPVLVLSGGLALLAAWDRGKGLTAFAFLFPLAGLGDRLSGGADAIAWPILLFLGLAAGWTFRFLYDFESIPDPSRADRSLRGLLVLWSLASALAVVRARTLWALFRGLKLRAVNVEALSDAAAIRGSVLSFAVLGAGAAFFFLLRRAGPAQRGRTLFAALAGVAASAGIAVAERLSVIAPETSPFWRATGRLSGGAVDPNALGILCALGAVVSAAVAASEVGRRRAAAGLALALMAAGLVLSGSRSGLALAAIGLFGLLFARGIQARARLCAVLVAALLVLGAAVPRWSGSRSAGARVLEIFDPDVPIEYRVSARPALWESAARLFGRHPVEGAGLGAFAWQLPNLLAEQGRTLGATDNPGNAYLQALAETGAIGFALTALFALLLAREAWAALRDPADAAVRAGAGAAILGFLAALLTGSHWFAPDAALFFFLLAAAAARAPTTAPGAPWPARARGLALGVYAAAALWSALATMDAAEAFRYRREIGFHPEETGEGGPYRWTQRRFAIRLGPGATMHLTLAHFTPEGRSVTLTAEADGRAVFGRTLEPGQSVALRLEASPAAPRVFRFALSRAFVPRRLGTSADRRELGVLAVFGSDR